MGSKHKQNMLGILGAMLGSMSQQSGYYGNPPTKREPVLETDGGRRLSEESKYIKMGLKKFTYFGGTVIWALNQKTADKKYNKLMK